MTLSLFYMNLKWFKFGTTPVGLHNYISIVLGANKFVTGFILIIFKGSEMSIKPALTIAYKLHLCIHLRVTNILIVLTKLIVSVLNPLLKEFVLFFLAIFIPSS